MKKKVEGNPVNLVKQVWDKLKKADVPKSKEGIELITSRPRGMSYSKYRKRRTAANKKLKERLKRSKLIYTSSMFYETDGHTEFKWNPETTRIKWEVNAPTPDKPNRRIGYATAKQPYQRVGQKPGYVI